jgi:hypothetical protein
VVLMKAFQTHERVPSDEMVLTDGAHLLVRCSSVCSSFVLSTLDIRGAEGAHGQRIELCAREARAGAGTGAPSARACAGACPGGVGVDAEDVFREPAQGGLHARLAALFAGAHVVSGDESGDGGDGSDCCDGKPAASGSDAPCACVTAALHAAFFGSDTRRCVCVCV